MTAQPGSPWIHPGAPPPAGPAAPEGPADVLFFSPWLEEQSVSPTFQVIREELSHCSRVVTRKVLDRYLQPHEIEDYTDVIRYAKRYPISLGILALATYLQSHGITVAYVQLEAERESRGDDPGWLAAAVRRALERYRPKVVGLGGVTSEIPRLARICAAVRSTMPSVVLVAGGPHVTFRPQDLLGPDLADVVVHGEGEAALLDLVTRVLAGQPADGVPGTSILDNGALRRFASRAVVEVRELPQPDYRLLSPEMRAKGVIYAMYTRACPYSCAYCSEGALFGSRLRSYGAAAFVDTLEHIARDLNWKFIHIADSTFALPPRALHALLDELERRRTRLLFSVNVRPDLHRYIDVATLSRMRELGFIEFLIGSESASDTILKAMRRNHRVDDLVRTLRLLKQCEIPFVSTYWMVGLPFETLETMMQTARLIHDLMAEDLVFYASAKPFVPLPGTAIFDDPERWGIRILSHDWSLYERYSQPLPHAHAQLTQHEIEAGALLMQSIQAAQFRRRAGGGLFDDVTMLQARLRDSYPKAVFL